MMNKQCWLCQQNINRDWLFEEVFAWGPYQRPVICQECRTSFRWIRNQLRCAHCYRYLQLDTKNKYHKAHPQSDKYFCKECLEWQERFPHLLLNNQVFFEFNEMFRYWIHQYKYLGDYRLAQVMVDLLKNRLRSFQGYQWVTIPSAPQSIQRRGFYATDHILEVLGIQPIPLLMYIGDQERQASKCRQERLERSQTYVFNHQSFDPTHRYLLFDDIYTTGSTMMRAKLAIYDGLKNEGYTMSFIDIPSLCLAREVL